MIKKLSKENTKLAAEVFGKLIEFSSDPDEFSCHLDFTSYVGWFEFTLYANGGTGITVDMNIMRGRNEEINEWLNEVLEIATEEYNKNIKRNLPENIKATKEKQKQEKIIRLKKTLESLEA